MVLPSCCPTACRVWPISSLDVPDSWLSGSRPYATSNNLRGTSPEGYRPSTRIPAKFAGCETFARFAEKCRWWWIKSFNLEVNYLWHDYRKPS